MADDDFSLTGEFDTFGFYLPDGYDYDDNDTDNAREPEPTQDDGGYGIFSFLADQPIFGIAAEKQEKSETKEKVPVIREHVVPASLTPRAGGAIHDAIYMFGLQIIRGFRRFGRFIKGLFYRPVRMAAALFALIAVSLDRASMSSMRNATEDFRTLRGEVRQSFDNFIHTFEGTPGQVLKRLFTYPKNAVKDHPHFFKTAANILLPAAAVAALVVTVNFYTGSTYALEVLVNNNVGELTSLGYVSNEAVFQEARSIVQERIDSGAGDESGLITNPTYKITRVKLNRLSDADTISDRLIESSETKLSAACGIYIDGNFICAVKNESDARTVFKNLLDEEADKFNIDASKVDSFADFVEEVEFIQGLYSDNESKMWDAKKLDEELRNGTRRATVTYIIKDGDYPAAVAAKYGITVDELKAENPNVNFTAFPTGTGLSIEQDVKYVRVQIKKYATRREETPFRTETVYSGALFTGDSKIIKEGEKGVDSVTYLEVYVDGVLSQQIEIERTTLLEPVNAKVQVGTKKKVSYSSSGSTTYKPSGSSGGYTGTFSGKLGWPATGLYTITSSYGYRSSGFHSGVDISGAGASGKIVAAADGGIVELVKYSHSSYGNQVVINHGNGVKTRYAHMLDNSISVSAGQRVTRGQAIGRVGSTGNSSGPHLHFEVIINGSTVNPLNYIT